MYLKLALTTATAIGLLTSAAMADNNNAFIVQSGIANSASILQSGTQIRAGMVGDPMNQNGDHNIIVLDQTGHGGAPSVLGRSRASVGEYGRGVDQIGDNNKLQVTQLSTTTNWAMSVGEVQQTAIGVAGAEITNDIYVNQNDLGSGNNSRVMRIRQTYLGDGTLEDDHNTVTIDQIGSSQTIGFDNDTQKVGGLFQNGTGNSFDIDQLASGNQIRRAIQGGQYNRATLYQDGTNNLIALLDQTGANNAASISQSGGTGNLVASLTQNNAGSGSIGNRATLSFLGSRNGTDDFSGVASSLGLSKATALQLGDDNELTYNVTGSHNQFAFSQTGDGNTITSFVVGTDNQIAASQNGDANTAVANQSGSYNNVAISQ